MVSKRVSYFSVVGVAVSRLHVDEVILDGVTVAHDDLWLWSQWTQFKSLMDRSEGEHLLPL